MTGFLGVASGPDPLLSSQVVPVETSFLVNRRQSCPLPQQDPKNTLRWGRGLEALGPAQDCPSRRFPVCIRVFALIGAFG